MTFSSAATCAPMRSMDSATNELGDQSAFSCDTSNKNASMMARPCKVCVTSGWNCSP